MEPHKITLPKLHCFYLRRPAHEHQAFRLYSKTSVGRIAEYRFIADAHLENYLGVNLLMIFPKLAKKKKIVSKLDSVYRYAAIYTYINNLLNI